MAKAKGNYYLEKKKSCQFADNKEKEYVASHDHICIEEIWILKNTLNKIATSKYMFIGFSIDQMVFGFSIEVCKFFSAS